MDQKGGWWCPVPLPGIGEVRHNSRKCDHSPYGSLDDVRKHFIAKHFDYGQWQGVPRIARSCGKNAIKCLDKCGRSFFSLKEYDEHVTDEGNQQCKTLYPMVFEKATKVLRLRLVSCV